MNVPSHLVCADHHRREPTVESDADAANAPSVESMKREVDSPADITNNDIGADSNSSLQSPLEVNPSPPSD